MSPQVDEVADVANNKALETEKNPVETEKTEVEAESKSEPLAKSSEVTGSTETHEPEKNDEPLKEAKELSDDKVDSLKVDEEKKPVEPAAGDSVTAPAVAETTNGEVQSDKTDAEKTAVDADENNVEVKMETSTIEDKPAEESVAEPTSVPEPTTQPPPQPTSQVIENKEPVTDVKPAVPTNEQPQPPKQQTQSTLPTRQYLDATVVPILHSALSLLAKQRPEDPIQFLGNYLLEYKNEYATEQK